MPDFKFPDSAYDNPELLLSFLGSYWMNSYQGSGLIQSLVSARAQLDAQAHLNLLELVASVSRFDVPVFHTENWFFLTFLETDINSAAAVLPKFTNDSTRTFEDNTPLQYGVAPSVDNYSIAVPDNLHDVKVILNRITDSSLTMTAGVDFWLSAPGVLTFRENPFKNPLVPVQQIFEGNEIVNRQAGLWLFRGLWDWYTVYEQFGYVLGLQLASSEGYKQLVTAILNAITAGTNIKDVQLAWSAITGVALVREPVEQVELVLDDICNKLIITNQNVYRFPLGSQAVVEPGDIVQAGDRLVDTLTFYEFNRGQLSDDITALVLGPGILATGYWGDLVFDNSETPLIVETDPNGYTKVSFAINGFPADVELFWDDVHSRGLAAGKTLAHYLDIRPNPVEEPNADNLPATINPLKFLVENLLRYNTYLVRIRPKHLGSLKLGLMHATQMRRIVPPHTVMLVLIELEHADEITIMDGPGTPERPGYAETVSGFPCMTSADVISPSMVVERVQLKQIKGKCE